MRILIFIFLCFFAANSFCEDETAHQMAGVICSCMQKYKAGPESAFVPDCRQCISKLADDDPKLWKTFVRKVARANYREEYSDKRPKNFRDEVQEEVKNSCPSLEEKYHFKVAPIINVENW